MEWGNLCLGFLSEHSYRILESSTVQEKTERRASALAAFSCQCALEDTFVPGLPPVPYSSVDTTRPCPL